MEVGGIHLKNQYPPNSSSQQSPWHAAAWYQRDYQQLRLTDKMHRLQQMMACCSALSQRCSQGNCISCSENAGCKTMQFVYLSALSNSIY